MFGSGRSGIKRMPTKVVRSIVGLMTLVICFLNATRAIPLCCSASIAP
jgi:hypothetical protein